MYRFDVIRVTCNDTNGVIRRLNAFNTIKAIVATMQNGLIGDVPALPDRDVATGE